jgi:hypothetical protein
VYPEQPLPTWLFLKKSRTSRRLIVQSRSEKCSRAVRHTDKRLSNEAGAGVTFFEDGVELIRGLITRNLLTLGNATAAKKAPLRPCPGNIRELENVISHARMMVDGTVIQIWTRCDVGVQARTWQRTR